MLTQFIHACGIKHCFHVLLYLEDCSRIYSESFSHLESRNSDEGGRYQLKIFGVGVERTTNITYFTLSYVSIYCYNLGLGILWKKLIFVCIVLWHITSFGICIEPVILWFFFGRLAWTRVSVYRYRTRSDIQKIQRFLFCPIFFQTFRWGRQSSLSLHSSANLCLF